MESLALESSLVKKEFAPELVTRAELFLGEQATSLSEETLLAIYAEVEAYTKKEPDEERVGDCTVSYDKYKKTFLINGTQATFGQLVASRHLGVSLGYSKELLSSGEGKRFAKILTQREREDYLDGVLNKALAEKLSVDTRKQDLLKSKAYEAIAERSMEKSAQAGVFAESVIIGVVETITLDRPDLGVSVIPANAYQDVEEKIDFIIETREKRRGVGTVTEEVAQEARSIGVQFTINTKKAEHKAEQIAKAKERGAQVDDIVYVAIDSKILMGAVAAWEKAGKPVSGPWQFLSRETRIATLKGIFGGILTPEQEQSLLKTIAA
ncbi:MAG: hypothetical protein MUD00_03280 [Candidatus Pacebacteria bacterium]|jgi:hypothetical protein|nr:hypothetical protein [Candidatus Paceibacterota bacterium]